MTPTDLSTIRDWANSDRPYDQGVREAVKRLLVDYDMFVREEAAGQERARRSAFTPQEIQRLVETSQPDPRLLEGDEECPFWPEADSEGRSE